MASAAGPVSAGDPGVARWVAAIDKWIFVFMALLFVVTTLVGFVPDSLMKIGAVRAGARPPFPPILHVHAVLMGSWLLLLLTQATLMATGLRANHMRLGLAALVLAPAIVLTGLVLVPTMYGQLVTALASASPEQAADIRAAMATRANIVLIQLRAGMLFGILVYLGLRARTADSGFHKRMMFLATLMPLPASIDRITFIPGTFPASPLSADLYSLLLLSPLFFWDLYRQGRVLSAYRVWFALWLVPTIAVNALWGTAWWQATAPRLLGYG